MPQDLQNSINKLVNSLKKNGHKSMDSYFILFGVIIYLIIWDKMNGRDLDNRNDVCTYMRFSLYQRYRNCVPEPDEVAIANRLMNEIDRIVGRVLINANNLNVNNHIN